MPISNTTNMEFVAIYKSMCFKINCPLKVVRIYVFNFVFVPNDTTDFFIKRERTKQ